MEYSCISYCISYTGVIFTRCYSLAVRAESYLCAPSITPHVIRMCSACELDAWRSGCCERVQGTARPISRPFPRPVPRLITCPVPASKSRAASRAPSRGEET